MECGLIRTPESDWQDLEGLTMGTSHRWRVSTSVEHVVEVQHATHSGRVRITVDGTTVFEQSGSHALWDTGFEQEFVVDGQPFRIRISGWSPTPDYQLWVNGVLQA